ncbi:MAG: hypothetical protein GHCLOJNM_03539 [bacterium]|nr:hypothetical protein [bacterium]
MRKTNFDKYVEDQLRDPHFRAKFDEADRAWDVAIQLVELREKAGLTQKELARRVGTTQQQISRLESPGYEGHSLRMLKRVATALDAEVTIQFHAASVSRQPSKAGRFSNVARA